jgi:hypothetical protein
MTPERKAEIAATVAEAREHDANALLAARGEIDPYRQQWLRKQAENRAALLLDGADEEQGTEIARLKTKNANLLAWFEVERKCSVCTQVKEYDEKTVRCFDCKAVYCMRCFPTHFRDEVRRLRDENADLRAIVEAYRAERTAAEASNWYDDGIAPIPARSFVARIDAALSAKAGDTDRAPQPTAETEGDNLPRCAHGDVLGAAVVCADHAPEHTR